MVSLTGIIVPTESLITPHGKIPLLSATTLAFLSAGRDCESEPPRGGDWCGMVEDEMAAGGVVENESVCSTKRMTWRGSIAGSLGIVVVYCGLE